jgi:hypothetical protein
MKAYMETAILSTSAKEQALNNSFIYSILQGWLKFGNAKSSNQRVIS